MTRVGSAAAGADPVCVFVISNEPLARKSADDAPIQKSMRPASIEPLPARAPERELLGREAERDALARARGEVDALEAAQFEHRPRDRRHRVAHVELDDLIARDAARVLDA